MQCIRIHQGNPPVPTGYLREMLSLILQENSFQFNGKDYLQTHGTAMGTKMAVAFANIFMAKKIYRWRHISMGHEQKRNRRISSKGKQLPSYNQIHGWNLRNRNYILGHKNIPRCQIQQGFYPWRANTFQAYRDLPIHEFLFVPPTRCYKGFIKGEAPLKSLLRRTWRIFQHALRIEIT